MAYIVAIRGDTFTAVSNDAARHFCRWFRPGSSIRVIPNFLPHETYSHGYDYTKQNNHRLTFVTVLQGWSRRKNGRCALAAFQIVRKQLPDARMVMIGTDYELNGPANIWASSHGLTEQVTFKGSMTHESMLRYIAQETDILVHPSLDEAFSVTVLECMALRKPVIGGINTPGLREVLNHGKVGLLVDVCSPYAVSESMHNLATNLILHRQMADAAFDRAWNDFRAEIVVPQYESLYEEFISQTKTVSVGPNGKQVST